MDLEIQAGLVCTGVPRLGFTLESLVITPLSSILVWMPNLKIQILNGLYYVMKEIRIKFPLFIKNYFKRTLKTYRH